MSDPTPLRERIAAALATAWGPQDANSRDQTFGLLADAVLDAIGPMVPARICGFERIKDHEVEWLRNTVVIEVAIPEDHAPESVRIGAELELRLRPEGET